MTLGEQWEEAPPGPFLVAAVTLKRLVRVDDAPEPLFQTELDEERLDEVIDRINTRFGYSAIHPGSADTMSAPMRISFSSIPDLAAPDHHG